MYISPLIHHTEPNKQQQLEERIKLILYQRVLTDTTPCHLAAAFRHIAERQPQACDIEKLESILSYSQSLDTPTHNNLIIVAPRAGQISPWGSKAEDILQHCALDLGRIERLRYYYFNIHSEYQAQWEKSRDNILPLLYDRMTERLITQDEIASIFEQVEPHQDALIDIMQQGIAALNRINEQAGLALTQDELQYLYDCFIQLQRNPTEAEVLMFAQANSEHCRHKVFNASWIIDAVEQKDSLFDMIRSTHSHSPQGVISAYSDNAAVLEHGQADHFVRLDNQYIHQSEVLHTLIKVETHNHPTAIAPYPGAGTGSGGEIRDEGATGKGGVPKAGLTGYSVSGFIQDTAFPCAYPPHIATAEQIMIEAPVGAAAFNNEFGRPNITGYFRSFVIADNLSVDNYIVRGYHKPIMLAGGMGNISAANALKQPVSSKALFVVLGGESMLIGMGGGSASSVVATEDNAELDFASVQRQNPEMQRRCQEVITACAALNEDNPIAFIHDVGAGGLSNALPELAKDGGVGAKFELAAITVADKSMSVAEIWSNESQERYVLAIEPENLSLFEKIAKRERAPFSIVGQATEQQHLSLITEEGNKAIDLPLSMLFGKTPQMQRQTNKASNIDLTQQLRDISFEEILPKVLSHPTVGSKNYLITIGDRTVGGKTVRDQMVGPWQVPVADCGIVALDFEGFKGEAMAIGERTPLALINPQAASRMAIAEAITNILSAPIAVCSDIKLSANWMAAIDCQGEDVRLFDAVQAASALCIELGIAIPVGKDSMSMQMQWHDQTQQTKVVSPVSLIVSAFAPLQDVRNHQTPYMSQIEDTAIILIDLGCDNKRLGGSVVAHLADCFYQPCPDLEDAAQLIGLVQCLNEARHQGIVQAYHDRSDGGLWAALVEMALASQCGLDIVLSCQLELLNEELGVLLQVSNKNQQQLLDLCRQYDLDAKVVAYPRVEKKIRIKDTDYCQSLAALYKTYHSPSDYIASRRDNKDCTKAESEQLENPHKILFNPSFDAQQDITAAYIKTTRPQVAILRQQGTNGHIEMAAAFDKAGFQAIDVPMQDLISGAFSLQEAQVLAVCGGFSYGDVLGAGRGWANSILHNERIRGQFQSFFERTDTLSLGICNGCQMFSYIKDLIPGTAAWGEFKTNQSEQFEARVVNLLIGETNSVWFDGMAESVLPVVVSHGEGRAVLQDTSLACAYYADSQGKPTQNYPANPNNSDKAVAGLTSADGRSLIMMPHPERVYRSIANSYYPASLGEDAPWLRLFRNAAKLMLQ